MTLGPSGVTAPREAAWQNLPLGAGWNGFEEPTFTEVCAPTQTLVQILHPLLATCLGSMLSPVKWGP
jgi:hypothetical protein